MHILDFCMCVIPFVSSFLRKLCMDVLEALVEGTFDLLLGLIPKTTLDHSAIM